MGFWEKVGEGAGKVASGVAQHVQEESERYERYLERYERYSDEDLKKKARNTSSTKLERLAAIQVLNDRGYGN